MFCIMFTGQGSQKANMGRDFFDYYEAAREVMEQAEDALEYKISEIMFNDDASELNQTIHTQPAIMINAMMIYNVLLKEFPKIKISCMAGHSVGEYNALCAGNFFTLEQGVKLLKARANAMENSCPNGTGGMIALLGTNQEKTISLLNNEVLNGMICEIANDNGAEQIILSGETKAMNLIMETEIYKKHDIKKAIRLKVSGPFHSSLMKKAAQEMAIELEKYSFNDQNLKNVISNVTAIEYPHNELEVKSLLVKQITSPVRWRDTIEYIYNHHNIKNFIEIGPDPVLTNLAKKTVSPIEASYIGKLEHLGTLYGKLI